MDQFNTYSKSPISSSFTPIRTTERSSMATYGDGYVYTGPLTAQYYELQPKPINEVPKRAVSYDDEQNFASLSPSINNLSLSSSPSTDVMNNSTQYQFKVMLLGDSGVGTFCNLIFLSPSATILFRKSIPTVAIKLPARNVPSLNLTSKHVLPIYIYIYIYIL
ncbi:unnamed protein product [Rotaria sordida]|uniref:Uncharacterized protein n=1 Tax=Rotaria sordida TaxID=392033 RepID=A0A819YZ71_9BILA|nr:unnamed protein product [Rotaria sordida]